MQSMCSGVLRVLLASEVPLADALAALALVVPPPGRMERLGGGDKALVVIDYAHSPDALEKVLTALRPAVAEGGELVCVFGCGGDRDAGKRPEMGRIAAALSERVIVTSDNPRNRGSRRHRERNRPRHSRVGKPALDRRSRSRDCDQRGDLGAPAPATSC